MKILKCDCLKGLSVVLLITTLTANVLAGGSDPRKEKDLYVLKTDRSLVGAKVDIYSTTGAVLTSQVLPRKKVVIDFSDMKDGSYVIRVSKGNKVKEYEFVKGNKDSKI